MTSPDENDLHWLCQNFVGQNAGVAHAVVASVDGLGLAWSARLPDDRAKQIASISSGLVSIADGGARVFEAGEVKQTVVDMAGGYLFLMKISDGSCLCVLAAPGCDTEQLGHQMVRFVERVGAALTPERRAALHRVALEGQGARPEATSASRGTS